MRVLSGLLTFLSERREVDMEWFVLLVAGSFICLFGAIALLILRAVMKYLERR